jgi:hypothetical protein
MSEYELEEIRIRAKNEVWSKVSRMVWVLILILIICITSYGDFLVTNGYSNPNGNANSGPIYRIEVATSTPSIQPTLTPFPATADTTIEEPAKGVKDPTNLAPTPSSPSPSTLQQGLGKPGKP